jgi:O-antigen/teichoic acid export membrane protein
VGVISTTQRPPQASPAPGPDPLAPEQPSPAPEAPSVTAGRMVRNAMALGLSRPFTWLSATGLTILIPRYLGDSSVGKMNAAFAFADWCGLLVSLGITTYLTKEVARRGTAAGSLVLNALVLRTALAIATGVVAVAVAGVFIQDALTRDLVYLLSVHMMLTVIIGVLTGALQGMQHLRIVALVDGVSKLVLLALVAGFLLQGAGVTSVAVSYLLSDLVALAWLLVVVRRRDGIHGPVTFGSWRALLTGGMPFAVWEVSLLAYARFDVILMAFFSPDSVLGWYYAAYRIISIPLFLPTILMTVTLPALAANAGNSSTFNGITRRGVIAAAFASMPMAIGVMMLADKIIDLFGYESGFSNAVIPIAVLAAGLPLVAINMIVAPALAALDKQRNWALLGVGAAVLNISLNLVAIPLTQSWWDNGAIGAGAITTLTEVYLLIGGLILLPKGILDNRTFVGVLKCLIAGGAMAAVLWLAYDASIFVLVPLGGIVYAATALALRVFTIAELKVIAAQALNRGNARTASPPSPVPEAS